MRRPYGSLLAILAAFALSGCSNKGVADASETLRAIVGEVLQVVSIPAESRPAFATGPPSLTRVDFVEGTGAVAFRFIMAREPDLSREKFSCAFYQEETRDRPMIVRVRQGGILEVAESYSIEGTQVLLVANYSRLGPLTWVAAFVLECSVAILVEEGERFMALTPRWPVEWRDVRRVGPVEAALGVGPSTVRTSTGKDPCCDITRLRFRSNETEPGQTLPEVDILDTFAWQNATGISVEATLAAAAPKDGWLRWTYPSRHEDSGFSRSSMIEVFLESSTATKTPERVPVDHWVVDGRTVGVHLPWPLAEDRRNPGWITFVVMMSWGDQRTGDSYKDVANAHRYYISEEARPKAYP